MKGLDVFMSTEENKSESHFLLYNEFVERLKTDMKEKFDELLLKKLINKSLIISLRREDKVFFYEKDLQICKEIMALNYGLSDKDYLDIGYNGSLFVDRLKIGKKTFFCYSIDDSQKAAPVFIRNIIYMYKERYIECERMEYEVFNETIVTYNKYIAKYIENVIYRKYRLDQIKLSNYANSSTYMGSKKRIVGFIVEAMWPHVNDDSIILDIMCGSGAVSNALAQMSSVYASDAQTFCRLLAKIQGAGLDEKKAQMLLDELYDYYIQNLRLLQKECDNQLEMEKEIFHMDTNDVEQILIKYKDYLNTVELYSSTEETSENILNKIQERKLNHRFVPYCLFTYYFSNIYFGLEQSMQIDSIRYAIDCIYNEDNKEWALGVLVVTVSAIASNHAGHFAQPKRVDEQSILEILEKRKKSAWLEFSKRLIAIAVESERYSYSVNTVKGPWQQALNQVTCRYSSNLIVYLDAPYKRDEYSRYYHVLETLVLYDYPASEKKGRIRSKINGERFKTEFFSKNVDVVEKALKNTIISILQKSKVCVWSYSNNGIASIPNIVDMVIGEIDCNIFFYSMPHKHASQRKREKNVECTNIAVVEYCIVFVRK